AGSTIPHYASELVNELRTKGCPLLVFNDAKDVGFHASLDRSNWRILKVTASKCWQDELLGIPPQFGLASLGVLN
ncbi:MAG: hypothetical protein WCL11_28850, partial [Verrucomicrobiota bacterium]